VVSGWPAFAYARQIQRTGPEMSELRRRGAISRCALLFDWSSFLHSDSFYTVAAPALKMPPTSASR
jgi:hypothetical protein